MPASKAGLSRSLTKPLGQLVVQRLRHGNCCISLQAQDIFCYTAFHIFNQISIENAMFFLSKMLRQVFLIPHKYHSHVFFSLQIIHYWNCWIIKIFQWKCYSDWCLCCFVFTRQFIGWSIYKCYRNIKGYLWKYFIGIKRLFYSENIIWHCFAGISQFLPYSCSLQVFYFLQPDQPILLLVGLFFINLVICITNDSTADLRT